MASADWDGCPTPEELFEDLSIVRGPDHVIGDVRGGGWYYTPAGAPVRFSAALELPDACLSVSWCAHSNEGDLFICSTIRDLEEWILGPSGYFNPFTDALSAFRHGRLSPFDCRYDDAGVDRLFLKAEQGGDPHVFEREYPNRRLLWR